MAVGRIVVTGAQGWIGRRVVAQLLNSHPQVTVVAVDRRPSADGAVLSKQADLATDDIEALFSGADAVVHLASGVTVATSSTAEIELETAITQRVLDGMAAAGVTHLVTVSSAMVYGAWRDNPVPITEDAAASPNPDAGWAQQRHRLERLAAEWARGTQRSVTVLRPAPLVSDGRLGQVANTLRATRAVVTADADPAVQFLHVDDLAVAVAVAVDARYDGVLNVAPDGWIPPDTMTELEGPKPRLRMPSHLVRLVSALRWRWGLAPTPPGVVPYTAHPWVVANDRLRALGWTASHSNEEAWVASHRPRPLESITAERRQQILLAALAAAATAAAAVIVWAIWRVRRPTL